MWKLNISDIWPFHFTKIGRFWDSKTEIDSVKKSLSISFPDVHSTSMIFQYLQEPDSFWTLTIFPKWKWGMKCLPGTVTMDVTKAIADIKAGKIEYRLDKSNIIHVPVGKASFDEEKLAENFNALMEAIVKAKPSALKGQYLRSITLTSTMGPGVKVSVAKY